MYLPSIVYIVYIGEGRRSILKADNTNCFNWFNLYYVNNCIVYFCICLYG